ncbi:hypothetical protein QBC35DRAFT_492695 [Podospora australis]|uniref:Secreted protein n=1 Tax=Podospora australis TaxID=1536484 RepID=A0AAN7AK58_9PEZI|nr:hypothetical protein QBC35DRAFT_492695 [Podospora australis]
MPYFLFFPFSLVLVPSAASSNSPTSPPTPTPTPTATTHPRVAAVDSAVISTGSGSGRRSVKSKDNNAMHPPRCNRHHLSSAFLKKRIGSRH